MKPNTITLQLSFTFDAGSKTERQVVDTLSNMADTASIQEKGQTITRGTTCPKRRELNRYVLIAAHARGVSASAMWMILYHHIAKVLHQHPAVVSYQKQLTTHLDALMEIEQGHDTAMAYLLDQITKYSADVV